MFDVAAEFGAAGAEILHFRAVFRRAVERHAVDLLVGNRKPEAGAEFAEGLLAHLFLGVGNVLPFARGAKAVAFDGFREDHGRTTRTEVLRCGLVETDVVRLRLSAFGFVPHITEECSVPTDGRPVEVVLRLPPIDPDKPVEMVERIRLVERVRKEIAEIPGVGGTIAASTFVPPITERRGARDRGTDSRRVLRPVAEYRRDRVEDLAQCGVVAGRRAMQVRVAGEGEDADAVVGSCGDEACGRGFG